MDKSKADSALGAISVNDTRRAKPAKKSGMGVESVKTVLGGIAGIAVAVLVVYYVADIDMLGWKTPKSAESPVAPPARQVARVVKPLPEEADPPHVPPEPMPPAALPEPKAQPEASLFAAPAVVVDEVPASEPEPPPVEEPPVASADTSRPALAPPPQRDVADLPALGNGADAEENVQKEEGEDGWRLTRNGYPRIDGLWDEGSRIVKVTQKGNAIAVFCEYQDNKDGLVRWQGEGKIERDGKFAVAITYLLCPKRWPKKQTRICRLNADGDQIDGHASSPNREYNFTWLLVREND